MIISELYLTVIMIVNNVITLGYSQRIDEQCSFKLKNLSTRLGNVPLILYNRIVY